MKQSSIEIGSKYGYWTVVERVNIDASLSRRTLFLCQCKCGNFKKIDSSNLSSKRSKSCGCLERSTDWTEEEILILHKYYFDLPTNELILKLPNRTYNSIKLKAKSIGLKRDNFIRIGNIDFLLEEKLESYYWVGFILADGHIDVGINRLHLGVSFKDYNHLKCLSDILMANINLSKNFCYFQIQHSALMPKFVEKFNISNIKTYIPPKLSIFESMSDEKFVSTFIGFVDGDGCIKNQTGRKDAKLMIKIHKNWSNVLEYMGNRIYSIFNIGAHNPLIKLCPTLRLTKCNRYCYINIANSEILWNIKKFILNNKLKVLDRKWDLVKEPSFKYRNAKNLKEDIYKLYDQQFKQKDIANMLNISIRYISTVLSTRRLV